jgi:UDP-N-acetylmuramate: L-alanyl-gamma-D-glutamyl-meso-diaminopimelate ligase
VLVGGVAENFGRSFRLGRGAHFVIEGDEYDSAFFDKTPKFLHYDARTVLLTSCEFDHGDIYDSLAQVQAAFRELIEAVPADGRIVASVDSAALREVLPAAGAPLEGYGFREDAEWRVSDVTFDDAGTQCNVWRGAERLARLRAPLWGRHNVENMLGAVALCAGLDVAPEAAAAALAEFRGVRRRQQVRGEAAGLVVVEDFAHHPTAVRETLAAMRDRFDGRTLWAVFEPRTNTSRRRHFEEAYADALAGADRVVVAGVYRPEQIPPEERMRPERVVADLRARGIDAVTIADVDAIVEHLARDRDGNGVALIMSNGSFGGIWDRLLARLRRTEEA